MMAEFLFEQKWYEYIWDYCIRIAVSPTKWTIPRIRKRSFLLVILNVISV